MFADFLVKYPKATRKAKETGSQVIDMKPANCTLRFIEQCVCVS